MPFNVKLPLLEDVASEIQTASEKQAIGICILQRIRWHTTQNLEKWRSRIRYLSDQKVAISSSTTGEYNLVLETSRQMEKMTQSYFNEFFD